MSDEVKTEDAPVDTQGQAHDLLDQLVSKVEEVHGEVAESVGSAVTDAREAVDEAERRWTRPRVTFTNSWTASGKR